MSRDQVYAVLMALEGDTLLLPNAAVAEVVARDGLDPAADNRPGWLLGYCDWNNRRVPVVNFEVLNGAKPSTDTRRGRIVVLNSFGTHLPNGLLGIMTMGYPHLVTINRTAIKSLPLRDTDQDAFVLSRVRLATHEAAVPDLAAIEAEIARVQTTA